MAEILNFWSDLLKYHATDEYLETNSENQSHAYFVSIIP